MKSIFFSIRLIDIIILMIMFFVACLSLMIKGDLDSITQNTQEIHSLFFDENTEIIQFDIK